MSLSVQNLGYNHVSNREEESHHTGTLDNDPFADKDDARTGLKNNGLTQGSSATQVHDEVSPHASLEAANDKAHAITEKAEPDLHWTNKLKIQNPKPSSQISSLCSDWWLWEILGMSLSIICECVVIWLLIYMDKSPLSKWNGPISFNAMISIFAVIAKSAVLVPVAECISQLKWHHFETARALKDMDVFDRSSRGPLGSLELLRVINFKSPVASLGAIIIFATLAFDPFTQQIVSFPLRSVPQGNETATFQISHTYSIVNMLSGRLCFSLLACQECT
jgi:hypothetical protein